MRTLLAIVFVGVIFSAIAQYIPRTSWTSINERAANQAPTVSYPRAASFSNGDYVVVYTVAGVGTEKTQIAAKIFDKNGSVKVNEFILSQSSGPHYAPNIMIIKGDL